MTAIRSAADTLLAAKIDHVLYTDYVKVSGADAREVIITEDPDEPGMYFVSLYLSGFDLLNWNEFDTVGTEDLASTVSRFIEQ